MNEPELQHVEDTTAMFRGKSKFHNVMRHFSELLGKRKMDSWKDTHSGTVICVGAGPSLDLALDYLVDSSVPMIVTGTAAGLPELASRADHIIHMDSIRWDLRYQKHRHNKYAKYWCSLEGFWPHPPEGVFLGASMYQPLAETLGGFPRFVTPDVGLAAIKLAFYLGYDKVVLVGYDTCFGPDGRMYASGINRDEYRAVIGKEEVKLRRPEWLTALSENQGIPLTARGARIDVPGWGNAGEVVSYPGFLTSLTMYDRLKDSFAGKVVNASEGGAHLAGIEDLPLDEALKGVTLKQPAKPREVYYDLLQMREAKKVLLQEVEVARGLANSVLRAGSSGAAKKALTDLQANLGGNSFLGCGIRAELIRNKQAPLVGPREKTIRNVHMLLIVCDQAESYLNEFIK